MSDREPEYEHEDWEYWDEDLWLSHPSESFYDDYFGYMMEEPEYDLFDD